MKLAIIGSREIKSVEMEKYVSSVDEILVFWNGHSKGTRFVIEYARKQGKPCRVIILEK